mgnify:CR=1 FL=1
MDEKLLALIKKANERPISHAEREEQIVLMAAANGNLTDQRITVDTVRAARTILEAADTGDKAA